MAKRRDEMLSHIRSVGAKLKTKHDLQVSAVVISADAMALMEPTWETPPTLQTLTGPVTVYASTALRRWQVMPIWSDAGNAFAAVGR